MLGAVAGDIIASPYMKNNAQSKDFRMFTNVRGWSSGEEVTFFPRVTDATVMTLAVARWLATDPEHRKASFINIMTDLYSKHPECEFSPIMNMWCKSEYFQPFRRDSNDVIARISPIALKIDDLNEAIKLAKATTEFTHKDPDSIKGAEVFTDALWKAARGRSKDDIRFAVENDYGIDLNIPEQDLKSILMGAVKEDVIINGDPTGEVYYRDTGKIDYSTMNTLTAALKCFLEGNSFEDIVRRAVALGGDSTTIASVAGALAQAMHKDMPQEILSQCEKNIPSDLKNIMDSFEISLSRRAAQEPEKKVSQTNELAFHVIKKPDGGRIFVTALHRKELIAALKGRFGNEITILRPEKLKQTYKSLCENGMDGTYVERTRPEVRTLYFQDGEFRTIVTLQGDNLPKQEERIKARQTFCELSKYAMEVKDTLYEKIGYSGEDNIHFGNAYYPVIYHDKIEVFKGDIFAGSVGIDPANGLLRIDQGGDFGPMEWNGDRTESVFKSASFDSIKQSLGEFILDEGVGIRDHGRRPNIDVANDDVAKSTDERLVECLDVDNAPKRSLKL